MEPYEELLHVARECADICADCAEKSSHEHGMEQCVAECQRCEAALRACIHDLGQGDNSGVELAASACDICADECEQFDYEHCRKCAESCRKTAAALRGSSLQVAPEEATSDEQPPASETIADEAITG